MAWRSVKVKDQRLLFINAVKENKLTISDLCRHFEISRPTAYKWIERFENFGIQGLEDKSKRPLSSPLATPEYIENEILKVKCEYNKWGPKKILAHLMRYKPELKLPCLATIEKILKKNGLVVQRKLRKRLAKNNNVLGECNKSNDVWCFDFKGWWITNDQKKCDPFTLTDAFSRYLLCCQQLNINDFEHVWSVFARLFREYGLPLRVRSDNGPPFASIGPGRLSRLSINLIKSGVIPEWIEPGKPQQNGRHERMHLTLKKEGINLESNLEQQLKNFIEFRNYYNFIRPHEALNQKCPGDIYKASERYWNGKLKSPEYSKDYKVIKVQSCGKACLKGRLIYIGRQFQNEPIGILEEENGLGAYYGPIFLGLVKENNLEFERRPGRIKKPSF